MNKKEIEKKLKEYEKQGFDEWQLYEIRKGLEDGVDISKYAKREFSDEEMAEIRKGLANENLEKNQALEIKEEHINKDVDINFDSFDIGQPKQIEGFIEHLDDELQREVDKELFKYINQGFNKQKIEQIRLGLEAGIDVLKYADPKYSWFEMQVLRKTLVNEKKKERELELNI